MPYSRYTRDPCSVRRIPYKAHALQDMPYTMGGRVKLQQIASLAKRVQLSLYRKLTWQATNENCRQLVCVG